MVVGSEPLIRHRKNEQKKSFRFAQIKLQTPCQISQAPKINQKA